MNAMLWMVWGWLWAGVQFPHQAITQAVQSLVKSLATERAERQKDLDDEVQLSSKRQKVRNSYSRLLKAFGELLCGLQQLLCLANGASYRASACYPVCVCVLGGGGGGVVPHSLQAGSAFACAAAQGPPCH